MIVVLVSNILFFQEGKFILKAPWKMKMKFMLCCSTPMIMALVRKEIFILS